MGRSLLVAFVFFAIFVAGIVTGSFMMLRWVKHHQAQAQKENQLHAAVAPLGSFVMKQMLNQLNLTHDQRKAAAKIILENADVVHVLRHETDFAIERMREDIEKILTPDQRLQFAQLVEEQRARVQEQREKIRRFLENNRTGGWARDLPQNPPPPPQPPAAVPAQPVPAPAQ